MGCFYFLKCALRNILTQVTVSLGGDKMDFKIEELEECYVVYMRYTGNHGNEETFETMRRESLLELCRKIWGVRSGFR